MAARFRNLLKEMEHSLRQKYPAPDISSLLEATGLTQTPLQRDINRNEMDRANIGMKWIGRITDAVGLKEMPVARKAIVAVIGSTIVLFGIALIVLPGPAFIVIPLGIAILASEFAWARRVIRR
jgi:tellurite resistance protein TerC